MGIYSGLSNRMARRVFRLTVFANISRNVIKDFRLVPDSLSLSSYRKSSPHRPTVISRFIRSLSFICPFFGLADNAGHTNPVSCAAGSDYIPLPLQFNAPLKTKYCSGLSPVLEIINKLYPNDSSSKQAGIKWLISVLCCLETSLCEG